MTVDELTQRWIRNEADAKAAAAGCRFDVDRACYAVWWIERYCRLYEGEYAGTPLVLRGAYSMPLATIQDDWAAGGREKSIERLHQYMECVAAGDRCDWQYECTTRLFGWVKFSEFHKRDIRRFQRGSIWVPKKNKKSPTMAGYALYLSCGDGEDGQKVFLTARDGSQIRQNVATHVFKMLDQSSELNSLCKRNMSEMSVFFRPTTSLLLPLSSGDKRSQKAKEGINGSYLVDEAHVVDREYMSRLRYAGISRAEPIGLNFSTAGNDPDSYGGDEFDYGEDNNRSGVDDTYFHAYYGAKQTLTPQELAADPARIIADANPALGHTINLDEAVASYHVASKTIVGLADFMMYRLNVWQRSSNPWIKTSDWDACGQDFSEDDMLGKACGAALDLGKVDDMTALSLAFPESEAWFAAALERAEETAVQLDNAERDAAMPPDKAKMLLAALDQPVRILTWYWLPEAAVEKYANEVPQYREWVASGHLRLTSGATLQSDEILADLAAILKRYNVMMFDHDPWYADLIVSALKKTEGFPEDYCYPFAQSMANYAFPSALFERLVVAHKLHHNNHPITNWQAGHVQVKRDNNDNRRPVKPPRQTRKKIDGIVAGVMSLDAATRIKAIGSCYEERGVRSV
jgi:phage terminase large subunit-like protein